MALVNDNPIYYRCDFPLPVGEGQGRGQRTWITITVKMLQLSAEK